MLKFSQIRVMNSILPSINLSSFHFKSSPISTSSVFNSFCRCRYHYFTKGTSLLPGYQLRAGALHPDLGSNSDPATYLKKFILPLPTSASSFIKWGYQYLSVGRVQWDWPFLSWTFSSLAFLTLLSCFSLLSLAFPIFFVGSSASPFKCWFSIFGPLSSYS